jgi:nucleoside-diphosphate-sugar epimerase
MTKGNTPYPSVVIAGCGDVGEAVAARWLARGVPVYGLRRRPASSWKQMGIQPVAIDLDEAEAPLPCPTEKALVYYFAPPPPRGSTDTRVATFLHALQDRPRRIVAISTSGVYGDHRGGWVTEDTPPHPQVDRARRRWDMEQQLANWCREAGVELIVLRVGGIYGPGRLPLQRIRDGVPVLKVALAPATNRIHVTDLAQVCVAAAEVDQRFRIYNVSDGQQSTMTEYFLTLAEFFGLPAPPQVDWPEAERVMSEGMLSYLRESRRMDNSRMRKELGVTLTYPDLRAGLASCGEASAPVQR